jgi:predicted dehydrogenase
MDIGIGLIGSGFMGRSHALAYRTVGGVFDLPARPVLEIVGDANEDLARRAAAALGFARSAGDWRAAVADPAVALVDITTPNSLHEPIAMAAMAAGKHVYCEKPLAPHAAVALAMAEAAEAAGVKTLVGFNYLRNPILGLAREIVAGGEIGEVIGFRGIHAEDYMADPAAPWSWRLDPAGGAGALGDLGSHIISMARFLVGPITAVAGEVDTIVKRRPVAPGAAETRPVEVDDEARFLAHFAGGARGTIEASWVASGRKMQLAWEITGRRGSLAFTQERLNELQLHTSGQPRGREGAKTIVSGPDHAPYGAFCPAPGHQLGFNDLKVIEVRDLLLGLSGGPAPWPDFREGYEVQKVVDAVLRSARERRWVMVDSVG